MKKWIIVVALACATFRVSAPDLGKRLVIHRPTPIYVYNVHDPILRAFMAQESNFAQYVTNTVTGARGVLQLMPVMVREVNRICRQENIRKRYTWADAYDVQKSVEMWYIVMNKKNPDYDLRRACQIWFGVGVQYDGKTWREYEKEILQKIHK